MDKVVPSASEAIAGVGDGARVAVGGFGLCGLPGALIAALRQARVNDLEIASDNEMSGTAADRPVQIVAAMRRDGL